MRTGTLRRPPSWRLPIVRGLASLSLAAAATAANRPSIPWLATVMAAYCLMDGVVAIAAAQRRSQVGLAPWCLFLRGAGSTAAGLALVLVARGGAETVHALIVGWAVLAGTFDLVAGWWARGLVDGEAFLMLNGLVTAFMGLMLAALPPAALPDLADLIALYATIAGTVLLLLGVRLALHAPDGVAQPRSA